MDSGYIKLFRTITDNPMWEDEPFTRAQAWIDILFMTNYHDSSFFVRGVEIFVKRGQFAVSEQVLSKKWNFSRTKLRKFLFWLEKKHQIKQQKNNVLSIYTVINYDKYNPENTTEKTADQTTERPQKDHRKTYTIKNKNTISKDIGVAGSHGNEDINTVQAYFLKSLGISKEDCPEKQSRQYWNILLRGEKRGVDGVKALIDILAKDEWHKNNTTSSKALFYKLEQIKLRHKAMMPKQKEPDVFMKADPNGVMYKYKLVDGKEVRI